MRPPTPLNSKVAPIRSGATSCTLRRKKERPRDFAMRPWSQGHRFLVNGALHSDLREPRVCGFAATAREHLLISHCSDEKRRFLAIGFFEIDGVQGPMRIDQCCTPVTKRSVLGASNRK